MLHPVAAATQDIDELHAAVRQVEASGIDEVEKVRQSSLLHEYARSRSESARLALVICVRQAVSQKGACGQPCVC